MQTAPQSKRVRKIKRVADAALVASKHFQNPQLAEMYAWAMEKYAEGDKQYLKFLQNLASVPVSIDEFIDSPDFMGATDLKLWPEVRKVIVNACKYWWKGLDHGAVKEILLTGATGCVDGETEFFSRTGWKRIDQYEEGDEVLQFWGDGKAEWVKPTEYHKRPAAYFYHFKNKTVNQMLTPGHRVILRATKSGRIIERSAEQVAEKHNARDNGYSSGKFISAYQFTGGIGIDLSDTDIALMVAATSLGKHLSSDSNAVDCRIKCPRKAAELQQLLREVNLPFNHNESSTGLHHVIFSAPRRIDNYASWYEASRDQLQLIAKYLLLWSGVEAKNRVYMPNGAIADFVQHVFTSLGQRASINLMQRPTEMACEEYCVNICASEATGLLSTNKSLVSKVPTLVGKCYCFTVPTGMWIMRRGGKIVVTGNTGKSEIAKVVTAYTLHILGCMKSVQAYYGLPSATGVVIPIQAAKPHVTKKVVYMPLRSYIEHMPWFRRHMKPNKLVESEMYFEKQNVRVVPGGSESDAILGEAIIGSIVDEINFMNVVLNSKKAEITGGRSGTYDQAQSVYDALVKRREGRFQMVSGPYVGIHCVSSSRRYKGDFTDRRQAYVESTSEVGVIVYDKAQYEARPPEKYCGEKFRVAMMNDSMGDIRVLEEEDHDPRGAHIFEVPIEYIEVFRKDPAGSMRDIVGKSTHAIAPFFRKRQVIQTMFNLGLERGDESLLMKDNVILGLEGMPRVKRDMYCRNPSKPRYVHIDLSSTGDRCGIAMVRYDGMVDRQRGTGVGEKLPSVTVEIACTIEPDQASEIDLAEVRTWVKQLKDVYGFPIKSVSYDGWSSLESRQQWKKAGMKTGVISVDKTSVPFKQLREAMTDGRISCFPQQILEQELLELEYDEKKDKVDHPPAGSKDCADAVCGAYNNLLSRSTTWVGGFSAMEDPRMSGRAITGDRFSEDRPE